MNVKGGNVVTFRGDNEIGCTTEWKLEEGNKDIFKWNEGLNGREET